MYTLELHFNVYDEVHANFEFGFNYLSIGF